VAESISTRVHAPASCRVEVEARSEIEVNCSHMNLSFLKLLQDRAKAIHQFYVINLGKHSFIMSVISMLYCAAAE
jgi:hypothetical protein